jgi:hypothetical protein
MGGAGLAGALLASAVSSSDILFDHPGQQSAEREEASVINVRDYEGLITEKPDPADRSTWDYRPAFEAAVASLREGSRLYAPAGIYRTSSSLSLGVAQNQTTIEMDGQIRPYSSFDDYLIKIASPGGYGRYQTWNIKVDIRCLRLDCEWQSRGIFMSRHDHFVHNNILIERPYGSAVAMRSCREADIFGLSVEAAASREEEPVIELAASEQGDDVNNLRFWGLNIPYNVPTAIKIGGQGGSEIRNIWFFGGQIHYLDEDKLWGRLRLNINVIELGKTSRLYFIGMNLRAGHSRGSNVVQIGDDGLVCEDVAFVACTVSASGEATNGIFAKNAERVSVLACTDRIGEGDYIVDPKGAVRTSDTAVYESTQTLSGDLRAGQTTSPSPMLAAGHIRTVKAAVKKSAAEDVKLSLRLNGAEIREIIIPSGASVGSSTGMNLFAEDDLLDTMVLSAGGADPAADLVVKLQIQSENT